MLKHRLRLCLPLPAAALLASALAAGAAEAPASDPRAAPRPDAQGLVRKPMGKPGAGLTLEYRMDGTRAAGQPVTLTLKISGVRDPAGATVTILPDPVLQVSGPLQATILPAEGSRSLVLTVVAPADGVYDIRVLLAQSGRGTATGVDLVVGQAVRRTVQPGAVVIDASGERLMVMPAR